MTLGIGIVGAGMIAQLAHIPSFATCGDCRVVALAELRPALGAQVAARFGIPKLYASHWEMLDDPAVEAVVVVTRRHATGPIVLDALQAGRHVLSEKPMCHTSDQGERLVSAARAAGTVYAVGYMKRHDVGVAVAKTLLDALTASGEFGRIVLVRGYCFGGALGLAAEDAVMTDEPRPDGLALWAMGPGWLPPELIGEYDWFLNVNVHLLNLLRHLLGGELEVVSAALNHRAGRYGVLDHRGTPVLLELGEVDSNEWHEGVEILFESGRLEVSLPKPLDPAGCARVVLERAGSPARAVAPEEAPVWAFHRQSEAFVRDVREGRQPLASGVDSLADLHLAEALWRAHLRQAQDPVAVAGAR